jgi:hypothetical protein
VCATGVRLLGVRCWVLLVVESPDSSALPYPKRGLRCSDLTCNQLDTMPCRFSTVPRYGL